MFEEYNGWTNRETWAFNLHWQNDEGLHGMIIDFATRYVLRNEDTSNFGLGEAVIEYVQERWQDLWADSQETDMDRNWQQDVGSVWRVDAVETGDCVRDCL